MAWYETGTVAVTNGSTTVTGSGTNFSVGAQIGEGFLAPDDKLYEIASITSATVIVLADSYLGGTQTGQTYKIVPTQSLVADLAAAVTSLISDYATVKDNAGAGKFLDGSVASPSIKFEQDQDTGFYRAGNNELGIAAGGVEKMLVNSSGLSVLVDADDRVLIGHLNGDALINSLSSDLSAYQPLLINGSNVKILTGAVERMEVSSTGVDVTGTVTADGLTLGDNEKAKFGTGGDLEIYHDGSNSYVRDMGTGNLIITTDGGEIRMTTNNANEFGLRVVQDDYVGLYHNNAAKLHTTSIGVDISGSVTADGLTVDTSGDSNSSEGLVINTSGTNFESDAGIIQVTHAATGATTGGYFMKLKAGGADKFTVKGNGDVNANTVTSGGLAINKAGFTTATITGDSTSETQLRFDGNTAARVSNQANTALMFETNATERMRITAGGLVGIGTSSPSKTLDVRVTSAGEAAVAKISNEYTGGLAVASMEFGSGGAAVKASIAAAVYGDGYMAFRTNDNTEKMRITAAGNVGIGTGAPAAKLDVVGPASVTSFTGTTALGMVTRGSTGATDYSGIDFKGNNQTNPIARIAALTTGGGSKLQFGTSNVYGSGITNTAMTIDPTGNVLVGTTATPSATNGGFEVITHTSGGGSTYVYNSSGTETGAWNHHTFFNGNGAVGTITTNGSATAYNTSSDYRLKTDVQPMTGATATLMQLKPCNFEWISSGERVDGFLAHELGEVIPAAATGSKDAMRDEEYTVTEAVLDDEGNETTPAVMATRSVPDMQGIDQSKIVPLLTATIQELIARIEALEAV